LSFRRFASSRTCSCSIRSGRMASASCWQSMDRSTASTPVLALKSEINTPPEIRTGCDGLGHAREPLTAPTLSWPSAARKTAPDARFISMQRLVFQSWTG
jgi:hypothetical protein